MEAGAHPPNANDQQPLSPQATFTPQTTTQAKSWRFDAPIILPGWEHHTGGSRSTPTVHPCPLRRRGCGWLVTTTHHLTKMSPNSDMQQKTFLTFLSVCSFLLSVFFFFFAFFCFIFIVSCLSHVFLFLFFGPCRRTFLAGSQIRFWTRKRAKSSQSSFFASLVSHFVLFSRYTMCLMFSFSCHSGLPMNPSLSNSVLALRSSARQTPQFFLNCEFVGHADCNRREPLVKHAQCVCP